MVPSPPSRSHLVALMLFVGGCMPAGGKDSAGETPCPDYDADGYSQDCGDELDCDDVDPLVHPGADEVCNDRDDDCDGETDEGLAEQYYADDDGDGYGAGSSVSTCDSPGPEGYVDNNDDCDDTDSGVNPDAVEVTGNEVDENCDSRDDDRDADGYDSYGHDCNDEDPTVFPGAPDAEADGVDSACDGFGEGPGCDGSDYSGIQQAIDMAAHGDRIKVCGGTYAESLELDNVDLDIEAAAGENVYVTGDASGRALTINGGSGTFSHINFTDSSSASDGGAVLVNDANFSFSCLNLTGNASSQHGGAVATYNSNLYFGAVEFSYNTASDQGGAIYAEESDVSFGMASACTDVPEWEVTVLLENTAGEEGGGLYLSSTRFDSMSSNFYSNRAQRGAAVYIGSLSSADINPGGLDFYVGNNFASESDSGAIDVGNEGASLSFCSYGGQEDLCHMSPNGPYDFYAHAVEDADEAGYYFDDVGPSVECQYDEGCM